MKDISVECWKCKKPFSPNISVLNQKTTIIELKIPRLVTECASSAFMAQPGNGHFSQLLYSCQASSVSGYAHVSPVMFSPMTNLDKQASVSSF